MPDLPAALSLTPAQQQAALWACGCLKIFSDKFSPEMNAVMALIQPKLPEVIKAIIRNQLTPNHINTLVSALGAMCHLQTQIAPHLWESLQPPPLADLVAALDWAFEQEPDAALISTARA